jgi:transcriptional regulator with XRE-family HTH domain
VARRRSAAPTVVAPPAPHPYRFHNLVRGCRYAEAIPQQGELAARIGVSKFRVWEWETGRTKPSEDELRRLCAALPLLDHFLRVARRLESPDAVQVAGRL